MEHIHKICDTDNRFRIDAVTHEIINISGKNCIMQYDHNSERVTFEIPRYIEGHDMLGSDRVEVNWQNGSNKGRYVIGDLQLSSEDESIVICSWLISNKATQNATLLKFSLRFICSTGIVQDYAWGTDICTKLVVRAALFRDDDNVETEYGEMEDQDTNEQAAILGKAKLGQVILGEEDE